MLEFEHLVQINDLTNSAIKPISRQQLWKGLLLRARRPDRFNNSLSCQVEEERDDGFNRVIQVGDIKYYEQVCLFPEEKIITRTVANSSPINAQSMACIEEPEKGFLFVRFSYCRDLDDSNSNLDVAEHLKAAYLQTDQDAIAMIRMLVESKIFDQSIN